MSCFNRESLESTHVPLMVTVVAVKWGLVSAINLIWPFFYLQVKIFGLGANCQQNGFSIKNPIVC